MRGQKLESRKKCKTMRQCFKKLISLRIMKESEILHKEFDNEEDNGNLKRYYIHLYDSLK